MQITQECDYAIRALRALALKTPNIIDARTISELESIPMNFLMKILRKLCKANIIVSYRGKYGGYTLLKSPSGLTLKDIIEIIDGKIKLSKCDDCACVNLERCVVNKEFLRIEIILSKELSSKTLLDLI